MDNENKIDGLEQKAREFLLANDNEAALEINGFVNSMAAFARSVINDEWTAVETVDDLPPEHSQYLWQYRNLPNSMLAKWYPTIETEKSYWVENFKAWRALPVPYKETK